MKNINILQSICIVCFSVFMISCGGDGDDPDPNPVRTAEDVRNDFKNLTINEGVNDLTLESTVPGVFWKFRLIVPEGASDINKRPLVLRLHGGAQNNSPDAHKTTDCLVEPGFAGKNVFILSPNSNALLWYEEANIVQVLALVDLVEENFAIDTNKTVVTGYSDGGNGSWFFSQYYSGLFSAAIPMATSYHNTSSSGQVSQINIPLYVIHGEDDDLFPVEITEGFVDEYINAGSDIEFIIADGLGHYTPCDYIDEFKDAVLWLETEIWN